jgi:hypothetical protein
VSRAFCLIRSEPVYRRHGFVEGLRRCGYDVKDHVVDRNDFHPGDLLVIWNRYWENHALANIAEAKGATVIVAENAYVANDRSQRTRYALALHGHNGIGDWHCGGPERWEALGIELKPWRVFGDHVLICPNRSFGMPGYIMPVNWAEKAYIELQHITRRPLRIRPHPGNEPARKPLSQDLKGAWAVVVWSSSAGVEALIEGIPVICMAPRWIAKSAAGETLKSVVEPALIDRLPALHRLAWAQWHIEEIESGAPFQYLRDRSHQLADSLSSAQ